MTPEELRSAAVPEIMDDCIEVDVLWDYHDGALAWYEKFLDDGD